jgi:hypothetical protein
MASSGISRSFPRLSQSLGQVPTRYSPVRHYPRAETRGPFDLHVLGAPPAFVLSQDQTLSLVPRPLKDGPRPSITAQGRPGGAKSPRPARPLKGDQVRTPRPPRADRLPQGTTSPKDTARRARRGLRPRHLSQDACARDPSGRRPRIPSSFPTCPKINPAHGSKPRSTADSRNFGRPLPTEP